MIRAVILDMDGVLIDSEVHHSKAVMKILKDEMSIDVTLEEMGEYIGLIYPEKLKRIFEKRHIIINNRRIEELSQKIHRKYLESIKSGLKLTPGIEKLLKELLNHRMKIGLVTSSNMTQVRAILSLTGIRDYFDTIISGDDVEKKKPNPECYLLAAERLRVRPRECVVIEDSAPGVIAAKSAGMKCIALPNPLAKKADFSQADMIIRDPKKLTISVIESMD